MNGLLWLLLLCCCGNKDNSCNSNCGNHCVNHGCHHGGNTSCIQPRTSQCCDMDDKEAAWTPYMGKNKQDDCGSEHSH